MSGVWKRRYGRTTKAPPDERGGNRYARPTATAPHPDSTHCGQFPPDTGLTAVVKGFGCQPGVSGRPGGAGVRKPPKKEPAGSWWAVGRLWGFGSAAALPGDGLLENC